MRAAPTSNGTVGRSGRKISTVTPSLTSAVTSQTYCSRNGYGPWRQRQRLRPEVNSVIGLLMAAKSGVGLTILPVQLGDPADELVRVIDPLPELMSQIYLLVHPDLRYTPRVRAFFDFVIAEIGAFRPVLLGKTQQNC
jgi:DNA-binding transcriptional LysR family regulator